MRSSLLLALLPLALLAGCDRTNETAAIAPAATVAAPATIEAPVASTAVAAPMGVSEAPAPGEHTMFDAKSFAGEFGDAGTRVRFTADGTYTMTAHAGGAGADLATDGTWTLEPDNRHVRLDPDSKAEQDRVYEVVSMDELHADNGQVLRRDGATAQR